MTQKIETVAHNMRLTDNTRDYVEKKAAKLERYLPGIEEWTLCRGSGRGGTASR